ncbi:MFS transporter, partial [Salmonella enterica]
KILSRLMLVMGAAPVLAPTLGGLVLALVSWRGVFVVLAILGVAITVVAAMLLPETLAPEDRRRGGPLGTLRDCGRLLG